MANNSMGSKAPRRVINSVDRAVTILKLFLRERPEWSLSELSQRLPLHKSTAHFLLATLVSHGLLSQDPATRRYRLGLLAFEFALKGNGVLGVRDVARPVLEKLSALAKETVLLCIPVGERLLIADAVEPPDDIRVAIPVGRRLPLTCGAAGKAYFAGLDEPEARANLDPGLLYRYTDHSITAPERYLGEVRRSRERGYALDFEEFEAGVRAVGFPLRPRGLPVMGVLCVVGMARRMSEERLHAIGREGLRLIRDLEAHLARAAGLAPGAPARAPAAPKRAEVGRG
jgi:DNA-binding IclR family transcriptional regulator